MKRAVVFVACAVLVGMVAGCRSPKAKSDKTIFGMMQEKANAITEAGGLAAVGIGTSKTINIALDKAKTRGRVEVAQIMEVKVDSMKKDFSEEVGEGQGSELNALFTAAAKVVTHKIMTGSVPKDLKYEQADGQIQAYALMVIDPKVIADAFNDQSNSQKAMYTRFRASQAFNELDQEIKKYEEFKKTDGGMVQ